MGRRRFAPLILAVALGALVLMARLFTVQILEGGIWQAQADALVRQGTIEPYTRGEILDARGRVLARDIESYQIEADYRDFRRGNALGVVAHARSALEMRAVPLAEARTGLEEWAVGLARLSSEALDDFARGAPLACAGLQLAACADPGQESRLGRAVDLSFYATALFDLQRRERSSLKKSDKQDRGRSFLERIAALRQQTPEQAEALLRARCQEDLGFLADFAALAARDAQDTDADPVEAQLARLEAWRAQVEYGAASDLFEAAARFPAGRIDSEVLYEFFDLDWIRRSMRWDKDRLVAWTRSARATWLDGRDGPLLDFAVARALRDRSRMPTTELVLRELAPLFAAPERSRRGVLAAEKPWFEHSEAAVIGELGSLFEIDVPKELLEDPRLPLFDRDFIAQAEQDPYDINLLARVEFWRGDGTSADESLLAGAAADWRTRLEGNRDRAAMRRGFEAVVRRLEDEFQAELRERLTQLAQFAHKEGDLLPGAKLAMAAGRLDRAEERVRYILKDRGSRHFVAVARPSYALVNLLTRYPHYLRGFEVTRVHSRTHPTVDSAGQPVARLLVGRLAPPTVERRLSQVEIEREILQLENSAGLDEVAQEQLSSLRASLDRPDQEVGSSGLERWFDSELAGSNGFFEQGGLAEHNGSRGERAGTHKVDGLALTTTLDAELQQEAEYCLEHPDPDQDNDQADDDKWLAFPTGAIVLLSPRGDVIVAASWPLVDRPSGTGRGLVADDVRERTLLKPDFQPPGSVFKPFVAAYALEHLGLDPRSTRECSPAMNPGGRGAGYGGVHCHELVYGHGTVDLNRALEVSCNSYFAWLGEQYDRAGLRAMAHEFGFGEATGVRAMANATRRGLNEDFVADLFSERRALTRRNFCEAGNGLSVVEATPMQVARATAGLATGVLPTLRLVSRIGDTDLQREERSLNISARNLDLVRRAMFGVANDSEGSARHALSRAQLGFEMAAKTGSADVGSTDIDGDRVLKHTWVAGWFPAENPVGVLVVFEHRTTRTSTHGAVWLARQFLLRPAVSAWIAERIAAR